MNAKKLSKYRFVFLVILSCLSLSICANAQNSSVDSLLNIDLEELLNYEVVTPTKSNTRLSDSPGTVSVITYDQIQNSAARTIPELLRLIPGVHIRWNPMVQTIDIRGFGSNPFTSRVLLLIDGIPYNSWNKGGFPQHPGIDFFNVENIKHLEVIRGTGSALYGENAFNGVINIVTLSGDEYQQTRAAVFTSDRNAKSVTLSHGSKVGEDGSIFVSVRAEAGQLPAGIWRESDSEFNGKDLFVKAKYKGLILSYFRREDNFDGFDSLLVPPLNGRFTSAEKISQDVDIAAINYSKVAADDTWRIQSNVSYAKRNGSSCGSCHAASQSPKFSRKTDHGYQLFGNVQLGMKASKTHYLLIGSEFRRNSSGDSLDHVSSPNDSNNKVTAYNKTALFIQDQISFPEQRINATIGLRYDTQTSPYLLDEEFSPRVALVAKPTNKWTLRGGWNKAARYPTFTELYQNTRFIAAEAPEPIGIIFQTNFLPNPNLMAEKVSSFELGAEYLYSKHLQMKIDVFHNKVNDPIVMVFNDEGFLAENHVANAIVRGFEAELRFSSERYWSGFLNWSHQNEKQQGEGVDSAGNEIEFTYAPNNKANMGITYKSDAGLSATLEWSWRSSHIAPIFWSELAFDTEGAARLDDYSYLNFRLKHRFRFDIGGSKQPLVISFVAKNLGNETPAETLNGGDGLTAEVTGREFLIGLSYELAN